MRKYLSIIALISLAVVSCAKLDTEEYVTFDDPSVFKPLSSCIDDISRGVPSNPVSNAAELEDDTKATSMSVNTLAKGLLAEVSGTKVHSICGTYWSVDKDGNPLRLSGRIMLPTKGEIKNIILVSHFTITADYECPSCSFQLEGLLALDGYALIIPDYIGYGATVDMLHPYLCANLTAQNVFDMLEASVPYLEKIGKMPQDKSIILLGYSQGGATTMAVQRLIETKYSSRYKIKRNFAGAGPYDIAITYDTCISNDVTHIPCAVPMIVMGMNEGENLGLDYKDFFKEPLLSHYDEWINSKKYTTKQLGTIMGTTSLSDLMTDLARQKRSENTVKFYTAMMRNSLLLNGWTPEAPVYMFHSIDDDTVPYINTQYARNTFADCNIQYNIGHYGNHVKGCVKFILCVHQILKD